MHLILSKARYHSFWPAIIYVMSDLPENPDKIESVFFRTSYNNTFILEENAKTAINHCLYSYHAPVLRAQLPIFALLPALAAAQ
jgi:hypothetical protein